MGKTGKAIKKRKLAQQAALAFTASPETPSDDERDTTFLRGLITPTELAICTKTLGILTSNPQLLKEAKAELKLLRGKVHDFSQASALVSATGNSLTSRISAALADKRYLDARVLLAEVSLRGQLPALGTLQRWVRMADAASRTDGSFGDAEVLEVLDSILRCFGKGGYQAPGSGSGVVRKMDEWRFAEPTGEDIYEQVCAGTIPTAEEKRTLPKRFKLLQNIPAAERLPPNKYPALLYTTEPGTVPITADLPPVAKHSVPNLPGTFLLSSVLSLSECRAIITMCEALGFHPDEPVAEQDSNSILAHNLYWFADESFMGFLWNRVKEHLPPIISGGDVKGINRRFRVYRYVPGAIYRPHIDGAWPASGTDPETGKYLFNCSPEDQPQWSRLTFLMYLNDSFEMGHTSFFLPSTTFGVMNCYPVKPHAGSVLIFPHGSTDSMLHEGSPVASPGAKYVIRTEVLYAVENQED